MKKNIVTIYGRQIKTITIFSIIFIFSLFSPAISAQKIYWTVITTSGDTLQSCLIGTLEGNTVYLVRDNGAVKICVDSLRMLNTHSESHFWSGARFGTLAGAAVGAIIGNVTYQKPKSNGEWDFDLFAELGHTLGGGILGGVTGFVVGGAIGASLEGNEKHDLSLKTTEERIKILRDLRGESK